MSNILPFTVPTYETHLKLWAKVLSMGEVGTVLGVPISGRPNRILNCIEWLETLNQPAFCINLDTVHIEDESDCDAIFAKFEGHLLFTPAEKFLLPHYQKLLSRILFLQRKHQRGIVFFFDAFWYQIKQLNSTLSSNLSQNIDVVPLLSREDAQQFVTYLAEKWEAQVPVEVRERILEEAAGHTWLLKEATRQYIHGVSIDDIFNSEVYRYKLDAIWATTNLAAQRTLLKIYKRQSISYEDDVYGSLSQLGFITNTTSPQVPKFVAIAIQNQKLPTLHASDGSIWCGDINLTSYFTKKECRLLTKLLEQAGSIVSRDDLATVYWQDDADTQYSDWALDQSVKRMRDKLRSIGNITERIVTAKGIGYVLQRS